MAKMFPDSGVPPQDALNSLPDVDTNCPAELWYSTSRCAPRFDPAAANAMLAELLNLVMKGEVRYDCSNLENIEHAVRYIAQRGLTHASIMYLGPNSYVSMLDPTMTRYNDFFFFVGVPQANNADGGTTLNIDSRGNVPIFRPDGSALKAKDLRAGVPSLLVYYGGAFWLMAPIPGEEAPPDFVDVWIRTDGNDATGDGSANTPDKAFKTVGGAWTRVIDRFKKFPITTIDMKLGIPGTYKGGNVGPFGGRVVLSGDQSNPSAYKIEADLAAIANQSNLSVFGMTNFELQGVTVMQNIPSSQSAIGLRILNSNVFTKNLRVEAGLDHAGAPLISVEEKALLGLSIGDIIMDGNGHAVAAGMNIESGGIIEGATGTIQFRNMTTTIGSIAARMLAQFQAKNASIIGSAVTGPQYTVITNSVISMPGQTCPGSTPGIQSSGGQFIS